MGRMPIADAARQLAAQLEQFARDIETAASSGAQASDEPSTSGADQATAAAASAADITTTGAAESGPAAPASPSAGAPLVVEVPAPAGKPSAEPTAFKCPQCGAYFTGPAVCANQHPPAQTVDLGDAPVEEPAAAGDAAAAGEPAAGPGPDWPAGA